MWGVALDGWAWFYIGVAGFGFVDPLDCIAVVSLVVLAKVLQPSRTKVLFGLRDTSIVSIYSTGSTLLPC